jgi:hypothetical protein
VAESKWYFDHTLVTVQLDKVARTFENGSAVFAFAEMRFQWKPQRWLNFTFQIV